MQILSKALESLNIFYPYIPFYLHAYLFPCRVLEDQKAVPIWKGGNIAVLKKEPEAVPTQS